MYDPLFYCVRVCMLVPRLFSRDVLLKVKNMYYFCIPPYPYTTRGTRQAVVGKRKMSALPHPQPTPAPRQTPPQLSPPPPPHPLTHPRPQQLDYAAGRDRPAGQTDIRWLTTTLRRHSRECYVRLHSTVCSIAFVACGVLHRVGVALSEFSLADRQCCPCSTCVCSTVSVMCVVYFFVLVS